MDDEAADALRELADLHRELATAVVAFQETVARTAGMSAAERKCAGLLMELGQATPGELAARTGLTSGAITGIVDRLVRAGYAERVASTGDRRSVIVEVRRQAELRRLFGPPFARLTAAMEKIVGRYSPAELALLRSHLSQTIAVLREQASALS